MTVTKKWIVDPMSCVTFTDDDANAALFKAEDMRSSETRLPRSEVRASLAREIGIAPGTTLNGESAQP